MSSVGEAPGTSLGTPALGDCLKYTFLYETLAGAVHCGGAE